MIRTGTYNPTPLTGVSTAAETTATRLRSNQRPSDVQPHVLRGSSLMGAGACGGTGVGLVELAGVSRCEN